MHKKGRRYKTVLLVSLLVFVILSGTLTVFASMIFSERKQIPVRQLTPAEFRLQQKIMLKLAREVFNKRPRLISQIVFKSNEMESLFNLADFSLTTAKLAGKYRGINLRDLEPVFGNGKISLVYPIDTGKTWLFGGVIRLKITGTPVFADSKLQFKLKECRIGSVLLPQKKVQQILDELLFKVQKSKDFIRFSDVVKEIKANPDGSWAVTYYPVKLSMCLF